MKKKIDLSEYELPSEIMLIPFVQALSNNIKKPKKQSKETEVTKETKESK